MLGAHFDSWHSGTGATDNAVGCGVALEAVRILKAIDPNRDAPFVLRCGPVKSKACWVRRPTSPIILALRPAVALVVVLAEVVVVKVAMANVADRGPSTS